MGECGDKGGKALWAENFQDFRDKYDASPMTEESVAELAAEYKTKVAACSPGRRALEMSLKVGCTALLSSGKAGQQATRCLAPGGPLAAKANGACRGSLRRSLEQASLDPSKSNLAALKSAAETAWGCLDSSGLSNKLEELGGPMDHPTKGPFGVAVELLAVTEGLADDIAWPSWAAVDLAAAGASERRIAAARGRRVKKEESHD